MGVSRLQTILVAALVVGCAPYEMQTVQGEPRADPSRRAQTQHEQKPGELTGEAKVSGNFVNVLVQKTTLCRDVTTTPMVADTTTEKKLTSNGRGAQYLLGGGAVLLAGAGVYWIGGPCSKKDTDAAGDSIERDCTSQEQKDQKNAGVGAIVLGGALAGMFVANVVRTQDEQTVTAHPPWNSATPWKQCETASARNVNVTLALHGKDITAQTDGDGIARFDLTRIDGTAEDVKEPKAVVQAGARIVAHVDLAGTPAFAKWKADAQARRAEEEVEIDVARKQRTAATEERRRKEWGNLIGRVNARSATVEATSRKLKKLRPPWNARKAAQFKEVIDEVRAVVRDEDIDALVAKLKQGRGDAADLAALNRGGKAAVSWQREFDRLWPGLKRWLEAQPSHGPSSPGLQPSPVDASQIPTRQELEELRAQQRRNAEESERERKRLEGELRDQQKKNEEQRRDDERKRKQERYSKEMECHRKCDGLCGPTKDCGNSQQVCHQQCVQLYGPE